MLQIASHVRKITIPVHILVVVAIGLLINNNVSLSVLWLTLVGWILISGFGIAVGFHRLFSHRAFETWRPVRNALAYLGCLGGQGSPIFWASLHMGAHHPYSDTERDFHSPVLGYWNSYMGWQFKLRPEQVPFRAGIHLMREPFLKFLHKNYEKVVWGSVIFAALIDYRIALYGIILPMFISIHQENLVDLFCHLRSCGYRNFDTPDNSVNNILLGILAFGQGWHNNHHAFPARYDFGGERWFEFDMSKVIVFFLKKRKKLAVKVPATESLRAKV